MICRSTTTRLTAGSKLIPALYEKAQAPEQKYCRLALSKCLSKKLHWQYTVYRLRNCSMPLSIQKTMSHANVAFQRYALYLRP